MNSGKKKGKLWKNNKEFKDKRDINMLTKQIFRKIIFW